MSLSFYNQVARDVQVFSPQVPGKVSIYTCGPTVYHYPTVGNWTAYIYWDVLVRLLQAHQFEVHRVMNITDVGHLTSDADEGEDKLESGARREGKTAWDVAQFYTDDFLAGMEHLNLIMPTDLPRATDYIEQQLELVRALKAKGHTYQIDDGIYFDTATFPSYADFAGLNLEALKAGARVEFNSQKRQASDFALWKFTPAGEQRDMEWPTPADLTEDDTARPGFPGWHLECSAMALALLGETLDIHTGGIDHIPVHHTNEIAQSESVTGQPLSRFWLHNNHLKVDGAKMGKSLGNGYTLQDLEQQGFSPLDFKLFVLQSHYRGEGNFTFDNLRAAAQRRLHWRSVAALRHQMHDTITSDTAVESDHGSFSLYAAPQALIEALSRDMDTPASLALIDEAFSLLEQQPTDRVQRHAFVSFLETVDAVLGLNLLASSPDITDEQKMRIIARQRAREAGDFAESDRLREQFEKEGIAVRDTPSGPIWSYLA